VGKSKGGGPCGRRLRASGGLYHSVSSAGRSLIDADDHQPPQSARQARTQAIREHAGEIVLRGTEGVDDAIAGGWSRSWSFAAAAICRRGLRCAGGNETLARRDRPVRRPPQAISSSAATLSSSPRRVAVSGQCRDDRAPRGCISMPAASRCSRLRRSVFTRGVRRFGRARS